MFSRHNQDFFTVGNVSGYQLADCTGGNPWEVTKKKAKKKKRTEVPEGEEAEVLADGDIRTKGRYTAAQNGHACPCMCKGLPLRAHR